MLTCDERKARANNERVIPESFLVLGPRMNIMQAQRHFVASGKTIKKWHARCGTTPMKQWPEGKRPPPDDYVTRAPQTTLIGLMYFYGVGRTMIMRWSKETGVHYVLQKPKVFERKREPRVDPVLPPRAEIAAKAAMKLQRVAPVYQCDNRGRQHPRGKLWRFGNAVMTEADMIARARRYGFDDGIEEMAA